MPATASISRRNLLKGRTVAPPFQPRPPGVTLASVASCTGCGDCVTACPQQILQLRDSKVALLPASGECTFCGECAAACPEPVFTEIRVMAHVATISDDCLAMAGITCMSCRDACPEVAITMRPRVGGPFLPVLDRSTCTGCGACIAPCPSDAIGFIEREYADEG
ncbi:ferredoxin-type protein NapF [Paracoccus aestuariivivens]|uniref:4Fe-4S dicluster domain-containing protein n=1 Tax=Paracoccus aestuariivivens TaxID=1820333 RepID=A0A6L6JBJ4_9RHOB|nr:ferredoxin-type protein NapF [Paracoccus aestuariivivens]MTH78039.1 4Fe-4S dicluster domain-containing protein [Paracoccus aestuariivivens]